MSLFTILYDRFAPLVVMDDALVVVVVVEIDVVEDNGAVDDDELCTVPMVDVLLLIDFSLLETEAASFTGLLVTVDAALNPELTP